ncbi:hypothetical protein H0H87_004393 [Tephrocybe sp. NHM501043]|nr:hypothetical protein H0H87_004393 [Tephrocybe sp. NHM501043]
MWGCYSYGCPRKGLNSKSNIMDTPKPLVGDSPISNKRTWAARVGPEITRHLSETEIRRQNIIHSLIAREAQYVQSLDIIESNFIIPLKNVDPPILRSDVDGFVSDVFGCIKDIRECSRHLVETMYVRQREEGPVVRAIGDVVFEAVVDFMSPYPEYIKNHMTAEKRLKEEMEGNFEALTDDSKNASRLLSRTGDGVLRFDLKHFLNRPSEHIQKLPGSLEAILRLTDPENGDYDALEMSLKAVRSLQTAIQLATFQASMGRGAPGKWEGEMEYVRDLESIENMYLTPLRTSKPPIIANDRLEAFIQDVFHNYHQILDHHKVLLRALHAIQDKEHPRINSIAEPLTHAALSFREAYQEYIPNYPIAVHRINDEMANNITFKGFVQSRIRHPDAHRLDMKNFINRPIPRLLRYELLLKAILEETPNGSKDSEQIPEIIALFKSLGKETESGVLAAKQKAAIWRYHSDLVFKPGENNLVCKNRFSWLSPQ